MISRIDLVRFVLVVAIDREEVEVLNEEVGLLRDGLRAHGVGQMPPAEKLANAQIYSLASRYCVRDFARAREGYANTPHRD